MILLNTLGRTIPERLINKLVAEAQDPNVQVTFFILF